MMTRKDFEVLAAEQKRAKPNKRDFLSNGEYMLCLTQWKMNCNAVMTACSNINERFNNETFKKAAGWYD